MAFEAMINDLIKQGLLDKERKLTQKGHDYVERLKKDLRERTIKNGEKYDLNDRPTEDVR